MISKLNLGCGQDYRESWVNADIRKETNPDVIIDINHAPLPFQDNTFEQILLDNVLEHAADQYKVLQELHRICEPGGKITFRGPHWNSPGAWIDPTHTRPFSRNTFNHYLVEDLFEIIDISAKRVRFGRLFPEYIALQLADHVGHVISEIEVTVRVLEGKPTTQ